MCVCYFIFDTEINHHSNSTPEPPDKASFQESPLVYETETTPQDEMVNKTSTPIHSEIERTANRLVASAMAKAVQRVIMEGRMVSHILM